MRSGRQLISTEVPPRLGGDVLRRQAGRGDAARLAGDLRQRVPAQREPPRSRRPARADHALPRVAACSGGRAPLAGGQPVVVQVLRQTSSPPSAAWSARAACSLSQAVTFPPLATPHSVASDAADASASASPGRIL